MGKISHSITSSIKYLAFVYSVNDSFSFTMELYYSVRRYLCGYFNSMKHYLFQLSKSFLLSLASNLVLNRALKRRISNFLNSFDIVCPRLIEGKKLIARGQRMLTWHGQKEYIHAHQRRVDRTESQQKVMMQFF